MRKSTFPILIAAWTLCAIPMGANAQGEDQSGTELANKLANPISNLISVPFQFNYDCCTGPENGDRLTLNVQPVIPFSIGEGWTVINRTILPVIDQQQTIPGGGSHFGLGDTLTSFFISPPSSNGVTVGLGPALQLPTATSEELGSGKWGVGPTGVIVVQANGWTTGMLANQIWSWAGPHNRQDVNNTFLQPFVGYTWPDTTGITLTSESSYNWATSQWSVPINLLVSHLFKFGSQTVSLQLGGRYYAATPIDGPRWGARFNVVFLFPG